MSTAADTDYKTLYEASLQLIAQQSHQISTLDVHITELSHQIAQLRQMIFGSRNERFVPAVPENPAQLSLGLDPQVVEQQPQTQQVAYDRTIKTPVTKADNPNLNGRNALPAHLRREEIIIQPDDLPPGAVCIGSEITEELEYAPGELFVRQFIRPKYKLPSTGELKTRVVIAPLPSRPLEKVIAGPALLAWIIISKYVDHTPLNRMMQILERSGYAPAYATITDWVAAASRLIAQLYEALKKEILATGYIHADETTIKVLDKDKKGTTHRGYYWVYNNSPGRLVFFDYEPGRAGEYPEGILKTFKGYLQVDGYVGYDKVGDRPDIVVLNCMAHARRKFSEALDNDRARAEHALERMQVLYAIERRCREQGLDAVARKDLRQREAVPVLSELGAWMKAEYVTTTPTSPIGKALAYSIRRWDALSRYTDDGMLEIDNNPVENAIRPVALGRKNYMFAGSHEAAQRSAMLYSLLGTCKLHGINPAVWLEDVLRRIGDHPVNRISELLPHKWAPLQSSEESGG